MSLINEALKKAQHQRTGSPMDAPPMPGGGSGSGRRGQSMPTGTLVLLIAGATVVVVISVVATVYFVNRAPADKVAAIAVAKPVALKPAPSTDPSPVIIAPVIEQTPSPVIELPKPPPEAVAATPVTAAPAAASTGTAAPGPESAAKAPDTQPATAAAVQPPADQGSLADRIGTFIDKAHVMGIRASGTDNKVLMNDHVYRINDVVDRKLGLRLVKIASDSLTFADANGVTYVKNF